jgi:hypothetical protein
LANFCWLILKEWRRSYGGVGAGFTDNILETTLNVTKPALLLLYSLFIPPFKGGLGGIRARGNGEGVRG